jgi:predicted helicase
VFHLRGNQRTSGERSRQEGGKIFGGGSRAPIAITLLVKNPEAKGKGRILFHDIGDYLSREEKLARVAEFKSIAGIADADGWQAITPDAHHDWLKQRDDSFGEYIRLGDKKDKSSPVIFENYSQGILAARDAWVYNASRSKLTANMQGCIDFYNAERERYHLDGESAEVGDFVLSDASRISWPVNIKADLQKNKTSQLAFESFTPALYRPFSKQWGYYNRQWNERVYQQPRIFPHALAENKVISVTGRGATKDFSALMTDKLPDYEMISKGQCFPEYLYEENAGNLSKGLDNSENDKKIDLPDCRCAELAPESGHLPLAQPDQGLLGADDRHAARPASDRGCAVLSDVSVRNGGNPMNPQYDMFAAEKTEAAREGAKAPTRRHAITDAGLRHFQQAYPNETISKEDLFYYIYGLLHSEDYRARYADNLSKELPRIPAVKSAEDFWAFCKAGRELGRLHVNYETVAPYPVAFQISRPRETVSAADFQAFAEKHFSAADWRVTQMKFAKGKNGEKHDKTTVIYNHNITISDIPLEAYEYVVNGKSALEWVMERQSVTTHKESGIVNDANDWAIETMGNPAYPLELFQRVITVSLETLKITRNLPKLDLG